MTPFELSTLARRVVCSAADTPTQRAGKSTDPRPYSREPPTERYSALRMSRLAIIALAVCTPTAGIAGDLVDPADLDEICGFAAPIDRQFPELLEHFELPGEVRPTGEGLREVEVVAVVPPELLWGPDAAETDRVLEVSRARDYARQRTERLWDTYRVTVPSAVFEFWEYDVDAAAFNATVGDGFQLFGGAYALIPVEDRTLRFPIEPEYADELATLHALGALDVTLRFTLAPREDPWADLCEDVGPSIQIPVRVVEAELVESWEPQPMATARTVAYAMETVRREPTVVEQTGPVVPVVEVASVELSGGCEIDDLTVVQAQMEGLLVDCYTAGLRENGSLDGTLTLQFELSAEGQVSDPQLRIDALVNQAASDCVLAALDRMRVRRPEGATGGTVNALVRFVRVGR